jgi:hypothetical protein
VFHTGDPLFETLEDTKKSLSQNGQCARGSDREIQSQTDDDLTTGPELVESKTA